MPNLSVNINILANTASFYFTHLRYVNFFNFLNNIFRIYIDIKLFKVKLLYSNNKYLNKIISVINLFEKPYIPPFSLLQLGHLQIHY